MKKLIILLLLCAQSFFAQPDSTKLNELKDTIEAAFNSGNGTYALAFLDLQQPHNAIFLNEQVDFHAASTMKTPVMLELFRMQEQGMLSLDDSVQVKNEFRSIVDGSTFSLTLGESESEGKYTKVGNYVSLKNLIYDMITVSSNLATNVLIEIADAKQVMKTMKAIGADKIQVLRGVEDLKAYNLGLSNTTTAYDLMLIFREIYFHTIINEATAAAMTDILKEQHYTEIIPALLPDDAVTANKTGSIQGVVHDSGIVFLPDGRAYIIILLGKEITNMDNAVETEANVSKMIYDYMNNSK